MSFSLLGIAKKQTEQLIMDAQLAGLDLNDYVKKENGKGLSSNDFTSSHKNKLDSLENYTHPSYLSCDLGFYKVSVDNSGHIKQFIPVSKEDLEVLGVQGGGTDDLNITKAEIDAIFVGW